MPTYGQTIQWTDFSGAVTRITYSGYASRDEAKRDAIESAKRQGWTPPRWWQFWRWNDTRISEEQ